MEYSDLPDLKALATLKAVVERGGVSEAARLLNIGQPAVTKRLRSLDELYQVTLMERVSGRLQLTEAGKLVYQFAVQGLESHQVLAQSLNNLRKGRKTLRLEVTLSIGEHFLPEWLVRFTDAHPDYRVESRLAYGRVIEPHLATGQADLAVMESAPDHPNILVQKWREDELILVCGRDHPVARRGTIRRDGLRELSYILREKGAAIREHLDEVFTQSDMDDLNVVMEVGSTDAIIDILGRGRHVSFLPNFAVADELERGTLVRIPVEGFKVKRILWIARNRRLLDNPVANAFIEMLRA
ncbi:MAG: LysR family transcriptional regulator [Gammaproteobacteria bacterium]|nr:LysR family transcriptional regulator [Gammaproteobacteria bacterium]